MSLKPLSGAHSKHVLTYHMVWCVKYRHTLLTRQIGDRVKEVIREIAERISVEVIEIETDTDHVHVIVRLKPTQTVSSVLHRFKGGSAHKIFREFPQLRRRLWGGHLWSPSKFVSTVGGVTLEKVKQYVQEQRAKMLTSDEP
jgi:putative transposase